MAAGVIAKRAMHEGDRIVEEEGRCETWMVLLYVIFLHETSIP